MFNRYRCQGPCYEVGSGAALLSSLRNPGSLSKSSKLRSHDALFGPPDDEEREPYLKPRSTWVDGSNYAIGMVNLAVACRQLTHDHLDRDICLGAADWQWLLRHLHVSNEVVRHSARRSPLQARRPLPPRSVRTPRYATLSLHAIHNKHG